MSAALIGLLVNIAYKVGAPLIRSVLEDTPVGKVGADVADSVIKAIAEKAGVSVDDLAATAATNPEAVEKAVLSVEQDTPELILAQVKQQEETNKLLLAEMEKSESTWTWAWRPSWMWFLMFCWGWTWVIVPLVNGASGASVPVIPSDALIWVTTVYTGLYMGGHTAKSLVTDWKSQK